MEAVTLPGSGTLLAVGAAWVPLAVALIGCKLHKAAVLGRGPSWYSLVAVSSDVVLLGALGLGSLMLAHVARGAWRWLALAGVGLVLGGAAVLGVAEHGFFVTTGALFDGPLLRHGLTHFEELRPVLLASTPAWAWVAMGLAACLIMAPICVGALPVVRVRLGQSASSGPSRIRRIVAGISSLLLFACLLAIWGKLPGHLEPLRSPAVANVFQGLFSAGAVVTPRVEPVEPLRLVVTDGAPRHNVVIVVLESTRAQSTTPYEPSLDTTPNLARLAARGALVREAYTTIPHTTKSLVPLLCGIPPKAVVANDEALPDAMPVECLPALLAERGWATALFQSVDEAYERGDLLARSFGFSTYKGPESLVTEGFDRCSYFGYEDDVLVEPALGWAERQGGPFLLTLATVVPHHEYTVPAGFSRRHWGTGNAELDRYLDTLRYVDRFLGKVVDGLEQRGLADDTLFVVIGDHGEGFGEHGRYQHDAVLYEEGLRVPLVLAGPGVEAGTIVEGLRQNVDVVPTVLELLGMRVEAGPLIGRSLLSSPGHEALFFACHYEAYCLGMRRGGRTYIHHFDRRPMEVYDVASDPKQTVDLAAEVSEGELSEARAAMLDWQARSLGLYEAQRQRLLERFVTRGAGPVDTAADVRFGDAVRLRGWSVEPRVIEPGDSVQVIVDFEVLAPSGSGWALFMHLVGGDRHINLDHEPVAGAWPVSAWRPGDFVRDRSWVRIPTDFPPGAYEVVFGLWDKDGDGERIPPRGAGSDDEGRVHIGPIHVLARR